MTRPVQHRNKLSRVNQNRRDSCIGPETGLTFSEGIPRLGQGGVDATSKPPCTERTGRFVPLPINRWLGRTAPSTPASEASHLLLMAQPPRLGQGGESLAYKHGLPWTALVIDRIYRGLRLGSLQFDLRFAPADCLGR